MKRIFLNRKMSFQSLKFLIQMEKKIRLKMLVKIHLCVMFEIRRKSLENVSHRVFDRDFLANRIEIALHVLHTCTYAWFNVDFTWMLCIRSAYVPLYICNWKVVIAAAIWTGCWLWVPYFDATAWYMSMTMSLAVMKNQPNRTEPECESERDNKFAHVLSAIVFHRHYHFRFQYWAGGDSMHFKQQLSYRTADQMWCFLW